MSSYWMRLNNSVALSVLRRTGVVAIAGVVLIGATACGLDKAPTPAKTTVITVTTTTTEAEAPPGAKQTGDVDLLVPENITSVQSSDNGSVSVQTPDQAVRCQFRTALDDSGPFVECDVIMAGYIDELSQDAQWCSTELGKKVPGFSVSSAPAVSTCVDRLFAAPPATTVILKDGRAASNGEFVCKSPDQQTVMTCWNTSTGNGFEISARTYQTF